MAEPLLSFLLHAAVPGVEELTRPYGLEATKDRVAMNEAATVAIGGPDLSRAEAVLSPPGGDLAQRLATICACAMRGRLQDVMTVATIVLRWAATEETRLRAESDETSMVHCNAVTLACLLRINLEGLCLALSPTRIGWRGFRFRVGASPRDSQFVADGRGALRRAVEEGEVVLPAGNSGTPDHESVRRFVDALALHVDEIRGDPSSPIGPRFGLRVTEPRASEPQSVAPPEQISISIGIDSAGFVTIDGRQVPTPTARARRAKHNPLMRADHKPGLALLALADGAKAAMTGQRLSDLNQVLAPFRFQLEVTASVAKHARAKVVPVRVVSIDRLRPPPRLIRA